MAKHFTVEDIEKKIKALHDKRAELRQQQEDATAEAERLGKEAEQAAQAGDVATYKALHEAQENAKAVAHVAGAQLAVTTQADIKPQEIKEAWDNYAEGYNKKYEQLDKKLSALRTEFADTFFSLVALQEEALKQRKKLAHMAEERKVAMQLNMSLIPLDEAINKVNYCGITWNASAAFAAFVKGYPFESPQLVRLKSVIFLHNG